MGGDSVRHPGGRAGAAPGAPTALKRCATTPMRPGCVASISESITAMVTLAPRTMRWTSNILSFSRMYCAASPCWPVSPGAAGAWSVAAWSRL